MRAIWSGTLSLVLVNIPVKLYAATESDTVEFDLLHAPDHSRIRYAKICRQEEREVPNEEIVRGFEVSKGEYVEVSDEELAELDPKASRAIEISSFVEAKEIDAVYFDRPYFLGPDKGAAKPFALLRESLTKTGKVALATFTLRSREHLAVVRPYGDILVLQQLRFADEVRGAEELAPAEVKTDKRELELATSLIDKLTDKFEPEKYRDTRRDKILQLVEKKAKGEVVRPVSEAPAPTRLEDLMDKLRQSLEESKAETAVERKPKKKAA